jgi:hypothetical protein
MARDAIMALSKENDGISYIFPNRDSVCTRLTSIAVSYDHTRTASVEQLIMYFPLWGSDTVWHTAVVCK